MARVFILEDDPIRIEQFREAGLSQELTVAESVDEAKQVYIPGSYDLLLLDHDLGGQQMVESENPNTGAEFCKWVVEAEKGIENDPVVVVHSYNPQGAQTMRNTLYDDGWMVVINPFGPSVLGYLKDFKAKDRH